MGLLYCHKLAGGEMWCIHVKKENENHDNGRIVCNTGKGRRRCGDGGAIKAEVGKVTTEQKISRV